MSYEAVQQDAMQQVDFFIVSIVTEIYQTVFPLKKFIKKYAMQGVTVTQLLALHSYRANYTCNRSLAAMQKQIYEEKDIMEKTKMTTEMALHIVERFKLGKGRYRELKIILSQFVTLPDYSLVSNLRRSFCPEIMPYRGVDEEIIGVCANVSECLKSHCLRMIQAGDLNLQDVDCSLTMSVTVGIDGRGDEKEYQQRSQVCL